MQAPIIAGFTAADMRDIVRTLTPGTAYLNCTAGSWRKPITLTQRETAALADALEIIEAIAADRG